MANLYANENFPFPAIEALRSLGHDVLTSQEAGRANLAIPDDQVLVFATQQSRAVLTFNGRDFIRLHSQRSYHGGIIVCSEDHDFIALAQRIDNHIKANNPLASKLLQVTRNHERVYHPPASRDSLK